MNLKSSDDFLVETSWKRQVRQLVSLYSAGCPPAKAFEGHIFSLMCQKYTGDAVRTFDSDRSNHPSGSWQ